MRDAGIVRNRAKIVAATATARVYLDLAAREGFARYLSGFVDGRPTRKAWRTSAEGPAETEPSAQRSSAPSRRRSAWSTTTGLTATATPRSASNTRAGSGVNRVANDDPSVQEPKGPPPRA
jgi:3-methyladenine DNA glycosylase Tag